ncbi:hypothetical protein Lepto7376_0805 [[Leptolyngbya] sp. PCC 7376]|uniref:hypothetical protein n=1 Tax=[Leptolyngbya] sp. PCC 7376 TaxID=111781 RepID=UPI00029EE4C3|nr:hypothetical protein [[Leptolyngbya] sp. PCC 7376]AFY37201.1 hypothetical protein Lepto7376_0805 [[Leptolyngbya] sp. PCC 7376]
MTIQRAKGVTESERYLNKLCEHTFLSLWSYPGVYRDQKAGQSIDGKEVCDLLVVFQNHIIIFSDKNCVFPNTGDLQLDWNRWFKKAIKKSAEQAWGAERWIRKHRDRLFLDRACKEHFPLEIPDMSLIKFHLVVVAHGESSRCIQELGGNGSLMIDSSIKGNQHFANGTNLSCFTVGDLDPAKTFIHVLNDTSLDIVMKTVDTISDFILYLSKKELFLRSDISVRAEGEEDLSAYYLEHMNSNGEHDFQLPLDDQNNLSHLMFSGGFWIRFNQRPERQDQIKADEISYLWDSIIERISKDVIEATISSSTPSSTQEAEIALRILAKETRFKRRTLSQALFNLVDLAPLDKRATRYVCDSNSAEMCYVFTTLPNNPNSMSYEEYRQDREAILGLCCHSVKLQFPSIHYVVGIATEPGSHNSGRSYDLIYLDVANWTEKDYELAQQISQEFNILQNLNQSIVHNSEYPNVNLDD